MAKHYCISHSRQTKFRVERDLWCDEVDLEDSDSYAKTAYTLCKKAALLGEFIISEETKQDILRHAIQIFANICANGTQSIGIMDGPTLAIACVLICQEDTRDTDDITQESTEVWKPVLDGLKFPQSLQKTGCSEQTARNRLCRILENTDNIRFFAQKGQRYYNTLKLHSLSPVWSVKNLYDTLYTFYRKNLQCSYDPDSYVAEFFVNEICRRWKDNDQQDEPVLRSFQLSSGMRELFVNRPHYMAAVCDALLERIDRMVQGDFTLLDAVNRWDHLLKEWYDSKSEYEKHQMLRDRKQAGDSKVVDRKENIRPEYRHENDGIYLQLPGIYLPGIQHPPVLTFYQNDQAIHSRRLSIHGSSLLYRTHSYRIPLDEANWNQPFCFRVHINAGDIAIYDSETSLYRDYLCFTPAGNETRLLRCSQMLRLVVRETADLEVDDPEDSWYEDSTPYRSVRLWTESVCSIRINGREILTDNRGKTPQIWAYMTPEPTTGISARMHDETVAVYTQSPLLHVMLQNKDDAKNYQITVNDKKMSVYNLNWANGHFQLPVVVTDCPYQQVQIKDFETGAVVFRRVFTVIPDLHVEFDQPYYLNIDCTGILKLRTANEKIELPFSLLAGEDAVRWQMNGVSLQTDAPRLKVTLAEMNAFYLPDVMWHENLKDAFLALSAPKGICCDVVLGGKFLNANSGGYYEIGTQIVLSKASQKSADLGILIRCANEIRQQKLTEVYFKEAFLRNPVIQDGKRILWRPREAGFIGNKEIASFRVELENSIRSEPFTFNQTMKSDVLEQNFDCKPGTYGYKLFLTSQKHIFKENQNLLLLEGQITISDPPEKRFEGKHIILTHVYYSNPVTNRDTCSKMRRDAALIDHIQYEGLREVDGQALPEYSGILYFRTSRGWIEFSSEDTDDYEKINPVFFVPMSDGTVNVYPEDADFMTLNLKYLNEYGVQIFSRKNELSKAEQRRYFAFADKFRYIEKYN